MSVNTNYKNNSGTTWSVPRLLKAVFVGALLFASGAFAARDMCQRTNTGYLCDGNWGIPREYMPQVEGQAKDQYLRMKGEVVHIERQTIPPHQLQPIQKEISFGIVISIIKAFQRGIFNPCARPIIVARNRTHNNIIDGHHTATACRLIDGNQDAIVISDENNSVLNELQSFEGMGRVNLNDQAGR